jgi:hypothetical protein
VGQEPEIRSYIVRDGGKLEPDSILPLGHYGTCPNVGDTLCFSWSRERPTYYSIQRRYFVDNHDGRQGWAIILREIPAAEPIEKLVHAWAADDDFWDGIGAKEAAEEAQQREKTVNELLLRLRGPFEPPLTALEERAMTKLLRYGVGKRVKPSALSSFGPGTQRKLLGRGFIDIFEGATFKETDVALSKDGAKALRTLKAFRRKYPESSR